MTNPNLKLIQQTVNYLKELITPDPESIYAFINHKLIEMQLANKHKLTIDFCNPNNIYHRTYTYQPKLLADLMTINNQIYALSNFEMVIQSYYESCGFCDKSLINILTKQTIKYINKETTLTIDQHTDANYMRQYILTNRPYVVETAKNYLNSKNIKTKSPILFKNRLLTIMI